MTVRQPRYSADEFARRGREIYERAVRPSVEATQAGKVVAIDIETEAYELAEDALTASDGLLARLPDAQIWFIRVGQGPLHRIGAGGRRTMP